MAVKHSTLGLGKTAPDGRGDAKLPEPASAADGALVVPCGTPKPTEHKASALLYNEYVVYDVRQAKQRFALRVKFHFK